ncbi:hypothetical protein BESB_080470 [Besnoitia besnoiti]|uniref:Uncharacterized protein n=1 Tax=Besnoitia besnoiti TaxID=94643 RepID=A0A2A9MBY2_BESBE|nr:hypothetical protein BESB_080470 [Besnoitia besnoiti]PFH33831.1 hypothetical protein BESB_080470 [Besnoitia besnoiti]
MIEGVMEWIRGGPVPGATFQIGQTKFVLPPDVMNRADVQASGLALIARNEGFKEIPPMIPKTEDGAIIITRPLDGFQLLMEHLLDLEPLSVVPLHEFCSKYMALKSEIAYWQLPLEEVPFQDRIYYETAWTDEHCLFPLAAVDAAAFQRVRGDEPTSARRVTLSQVDKQPEEISKAFLDVGGADDAADWSFFVFDPAAMTPPGSDPKKASLGRLVLAVGPKKFFCKIPFLTDPCVHYGALSERDRDLAPFAILVSASECTIVWNRGCFIHVKVEESKHGAKFAEVNVFHREPSWLCVHPFLDYVISGVKGPVPHVYCFDMPDASVVRFFPWGCLVVNGEVTLEGRRKKDDPAAPASLPAPSAPVPQASSSQGENNFRRLLTYLQPESASKKGAPVEGMSEYRPAKPVVVAGVLRSKMKVVMPIEKVHLINMDLEPDSSVTLRHGVNYDILDVRNSEGSDFEIVLSVNGGLVSRTREEFMEIRQGNPVAVVGVTGKGELVPQSHLLIPNGAPVGEMFRSLTLIGEYITREKSYYSFELGKKLFEFHRSLYIVRAGREGACNIM